MSNSLAIAAVTTTLRHVLHESLGGSEPDPVGGADVTTFRPAQLADSDTVGASATGINVYLYQVAANHAWNLTDLPTRRADGSLALRPLAALDLHYLLTCYGAEESLDAQRLLARAVLALAVKPVFTRDVVVAAMDKYDVEPTGFLARADLSEQVDLVKVSPTPLTLEEMSRLWGIFGTPYLLSLTYTATVVLLEADVSPRVSRPVLERSLVIAVTGRPRIDEITTIPPNTPVLTGSTVVIDGTALLGPGARVKVGAVEVTPAPTSTALRLECTLPPSVLSGVQPLRIVHYSPAGPPGSAPARVLATSNALPVMVRPSVTSLTLSADDLTVSVAPPLASGQRAVVTLSRLSGGADDDPPDLSHAFDRVQAADAPQSDFALARSAITAGRWLVRVEVDGVESLPTLVGETYGAPATTVP